VTTSKTLIVAFVLLAGCAPKPQPFVGPPEPKTAIPSGWLSHAGDRIVQEADQIDAQVALGRAEAPTLGVWSAISLSVADLRDIVVRDIGEIVTRLKAADAECRRLAAQVAALQDPARQREARIWSGFLVFGGGAAAVGMACVIGSFWVRSSALTAVGVIALTLGGSCALVGFVGREVDLFLGVWGKVLGGAVVLAVVSLIAFGVWMVFSNRQRMVAGLIGRAERLKTALPVGVDAGAILADGNEQLDRVVNKVRTKLGLKDE